MNMDAMLYLHSAIVKQTDCSATHYSSDSSTQFNSETGGMASLSNSVTKTPQDDEKCCSRFCGDTDGITDIVCGGDQSLSTTGRKREVFAVYIFDISCTGNAGGRYGMGRVNDGTTGTESTKVRDYLLEKLVEEESRASCKAPFEDIPECEGLVLFTGGNTRELSARQSNIDEECIHEGSGDTHMKTHVNLDTKHFLSDLTSPGKVQSKVNIMDTKPTCPHYKIAQSQTLLEGQGTTTPQRNGTSSHETAKTTRKGYSNGHLGQRSNICCQGRIYCDNISERGNPHSGLNRSYFLGDVKGFVLFALLLAMTACPLTLAVPAYGENGYGQEDYYNSQNGEEHVEKSNSENYRHSQVVGAVSIIVVVLINVPLVNQYSCYDSGDLLINTNKSKTCEAI